MGAERGEGRWVLVWQLWYVFGLKGGRRQLSSAGNEGVRLRLVDVSWPFGPLWFSFAKAKGGERWRLVCDSGDNGARRSRKGKKLGGGRGLFLAEGPVNGGLCVDPFRLLFFSFISPQNFLRPCASKFLSPHPLNFSPPRFFTVECYL